MTDRGHGSSASGDVICEDGEAREGSEGVEEVLVEVDREGAMDDEFRQEQQLEKTKKKLSRGKKYVRSNPLLSLCPSLLSTIL